MWVLQPLVVSMIQSKRSYENSRLGKFRIFFKGRSECPLKNLQLGKGCSNRAEIIWEWKALTLEQLGFFSLGNLLSTLHYWYGSGFSLSRIFCKIPKTYQVYILLVLQSSIAAVLKALKCIFVLYKKGTSVLFWKNAILGTWNYKTLVSSLWRHRGVRTRAKSFMWDKQ